MHLIAQTRVRTCVECGAFRCEPPEQIRSRNLFDRGGSKTQPNLLGYRILFI